MKGIYVIRRSDEYLLEHSEDYVEHFGIPGMTWGKKKASISEADKYRLSNAISYGGYSAKNAAAQTDRSAAISNMNAINKQYTKMEQDNQILNQQLKKLEKEFEDNKFPYQDTKYDGNLKEKMKGITNPAYGKKYDKLVKLKSQIDTIKKEIASNKIKMSQLELAFKSRPR